MVKNSQITDIILLFLSAGFWFLAILVSIPFFGLIDPLINGPRWWLSFKEVVEFLLFIPTNIDMLPRLFSGSSTNEKILIWMGIPALIAWISGLIGVYRVDDSGRGKWLPVLGVFLFIPLLGLISTLVTLGRLKS